MTVLSRGEIKCIRNLAWWCMLVIPVFRRLRQEGLNLEANLRAHIVNLSVKNKQER